MFNFKDNDPRFITILSNKTLTVFAASAHVQKSGATNLSHLDTDPIMYCKRQT